MNTPCSYSRVLPLLVSEEIVNRPFTPLTYVSSRFNTPSPSNGEQSISRNITPQSDESFRVSANPRVTDYLDPTQTPKVNPSTPRTPTECSPPFHNSPLISCTETPLSGKTPPNYSKIYPSHLLEEALLLLQELRFYLSSM